MVRNWGAAARKDVARWKDTWLGAADVVAVVGSEVSNLELAETEEGVVTLGHAFNRLTESTVGLTAAEMEHSKATKKILDDDKIKKNLIDQQEKHLRKKIEEHRKAKSLTGIEGFKGKPLTEAQAFAKAIEAQIEKLKLIDPPMGRYVEHIKKMHYALEGGALTQKEFADGAVEAGKRFLKLSDDVEETTSAYDLYIERMDIVNPKMSTFVQGIAEMQEALSRGLITVPEFSEQIRILAEELNKIKPDEDDVMKKYIDELKLSIEGFSRDAGQAFADFAQKGSVDFRAFADSIINDLIRMAAQKLIFDQMFGALSGAFDNIGSGNMASPPPVAPAYNPGVSPILYTSHGNAFSGGNVVPFKKGGIVNGPTTFALKKWCWYYGRSWSRRRVTAQENKKRCSWCSVFWWRRGICCQYKC